MINIAQGMRPIISYYGGKQKIASKIIPLIPKHTVYCEPFCGGATLLFKKPWPGTTNNNHYREIINDTDKKLINMYRIIQTRFDEFTHLLQNTLHSEEEYKKSAMILRSEIEADELWSAWAYYVNIQQSFSRRLLGGWGRSIFSRNEGATWSNRLEKFNQYRDRMCSVQISCADALKFIKQYDSPQTFFYCDPPYIGTNQGHYAGYTLDDFQALLTTLAGIQGSFLLSTYDVPGVVIPDNWERFEIASVCSASAKGKIGSDRTRKSTKKEIGDRSRTELIYRKFSIEPRPEIKASYASGSFDCFVSHPFEVVVKRMFQEVLF